MSRIIFFISLLIMYEGIAQTYASFEKWMPKPSAPYALTTSVIPNSMTCESYYGNNTWCVFKIDSVQGSSIKGRHQWLMRMDSDGNNLWSKKIVCKDSYVNSIIPTPDDGVLFIGITPNGVYWAGWLCKIDKDGNIQWTKQYKDTSPFIQLGFTQGIYKDGYYYVQGGRGGTNSLSLSKIDTSGNIKWTKLYRDTTYSNMPLFTLYSIYSHNQQIISCSGMGTMGFLIKMDTAGNIKFQKAYMSTYNLFDWFRMRNVVPINNNLLIFYNDHVSSMFLIDSLGKVLWNNYYSSYAEKKYQLPVLLKNGTLYCHTGRVSSMYKFSGSSIAPVYASVVYNNNMPENPIQGYNYFSELNTTDKIILTSDNSSSKLYIQKIDTTLITHCPQTYASHRDTVVMVRDTICNFYTVFPSPNYIVTPLTGFRTEPLNLQWTLECAKLAPSSIISHNKPTFNFVLYPNPAQEHITLRTEFKNYELRLWDSYGKLLYVIPNVQQSEYMFPILHLSQGTYHIECIANNQHYIQSFVKMN